MNEQKMIDARWCRERGACYSDKRLAALFDRPMGVPEVLTRRDGRWRRVPARDRMWVFFRAASQAAQAVVATQAADRQVRAHCLHCGIKTVERWAARWLSGEDRSAAAARASASLALRAGAWVPESAARAAVWSAVAAARAGARVTSLAAAEAAQAAAWAARAGARAAGLAKAEAARTAERRAELADAIEVLAAEAAKEKA